MHLNLEQITTNRAFLSKNVKKLFRAGRYKKFHMKRKFAAWIASSNAAHFGTIPQLEFSRLEGTLENVSS